MKQLIAIMAALVAFTAGPLLAQSSSSSSSTSGSTSSVGINSSTTAYIDNRTINPRSSTQTIRSTGNAYAPALGDGNPCALSTSIGIGLVGEAFSGGSQRTDPICWLVRMGKNDAAIYMLATKNRSTCVALRATGHIAPTFTCKGDPRVIPQKTATASSVSATASRYTLQGDVTCVRDGNKIVPRVSSQAALDALGKDAIKRYCRNAG